MSVAVGVAADGVRLPLLRRVVVDAVGAVLRSEKAGAAMISVTFLSNARMRALNKRHLGRSGATDVISFGFRRTTRRAPIVGDIYIAPAVARVSARSNGVGAREELVRLVVHGTLHVLGYDHPESATRTRSTMWSKQERLVDRLVRRDR